MCPSGMEPDEARLVVRADSARCTYNNLPESATPSASSSHVQKDVVANLITRFAGLVTARQRARMEFT